MSRYSHLPYFREQREMKQLSKIALIILGIAITLAIMMVTAFLIGMGAFN